LITDGKTQSAQFDEFAYHESLVHPAMLKFAMSAVSTSATSPASTNGSSSSPSDSGPKRVFIGGGGELATAREVLKHKSVEKVIMVDLDEEVVNVSKQYLPEWGGRDVLNDERFQLVVGDAHAYMMETEDVFDVIIMDISDPVEAGPGVMLYTTEFYRRAAECLSKPHGVLVTQSGMAEAIPVANRRFINVDDPSCFAPIHNTLNTAFDCVIPYSVNIPSFGSDWGFNMAFRSESATSVSPRGEASYSIVEQQKEEWQYPSHKGRNIDELIERHIAKGADALQFYDGITHLTMFSLSKPLRRYMDNDKRVITRDDPIFMY